MNEQLESALQERAAAMFAGLGYVDFCTIADEAARACRARIWQRRTTGKASGWMIPDPILDRAWEIAQGYAN